MEETIFVYKLVENNQYTAPKTYTFKDKINVGIYDNFEIDFKELNL